MHVQAEDEVGARDLLHVLDDDLVAFAFGDFLVGPVGEGVRAGRGDDEALLARETEELFAQVDDLPARVADVGADRRAEFDDGLVHLGLHAFAEGHLAVGEDLLDVRAQVARLRVDDLEFLFDAEGEEAAGAGGGAGRGLGRDRLGRSFGGIFFHGREGDGELRTES